MHNIIIVGVLDNPSSTNVSMAISFTRFGYNVIPVNYRTLMQKSYSFFENYLFTAIEKYNPEFIIFCKCNNVLTKTIEECTKKTKTLLWFMDAYPILEACPEIVDHAKKCTYVSCTSPNSCQYLVDKGVSENKVYHIFEGMDITIHKPVEPVEEYKVDISFIGSKTPLRQEICDYLIQNNVDTKFYGPGFTSFIEPTEWAKICSSSKMMLSLGTFNDIPNYFPGRVFETLGCGVATVHYDTTSTIKKYFRVGKEILIFKSKEELIDIIKNMTDEKACSLAINGREKCLRGYTWEHSVSKIIGIFNNEKTNSN